MNSKYNIDLTNRRFGFLTALKCIPSPSYNKWECICDCGNRTISLSYYLLKNKTKSCGPNHADLIGKKFQYLTVIKRVENSAGNKNRNWLCKCDCGNTKKVSTGFLKAKNRIISCGCKGLKRYHGRELAVHYLWSLYKGKAKSRGLTFNIDKEYFNTLINSSCFFCGTPPIKVYSVGVNDIKYNGLDRVDNSIGYEKDNVVPCCTICNRAKLDKSLKHFISWGLKLGKNLKERKTICSTLG